MEVEWTVYLSNSLLSGTIYSIRLVEFLAMTMQEGIDRCSKVSSRLCNRRSEIYRFRDRYKRRTQSVTRLISQESAQAMIGCAELKIA